MFGKFSKKYYLLTCIMMYAMVSRAQTDSIRFTGTISISKSNTYKYKIVVGLHNNQWKGYSILDAGGPNETKSTTEVVFSKSKSAMIFAEKKLISSKAKDVSFCFVGGLLKMNEKRQQLKGYFLGQDEKKQLCGNGTVKFDLPKTAIALMEDDGAKDTSLINSVITSKNDKTFEVKKERIDLELWDGGIHDGDSLVISLNGQIIQPAFEISSTIKTIQILIPKGNNTLKITAINEGEEPPNSARIKVIDGDKNYTLVSFLLKGESATIHIKR